MDKRQGRSLSGGGGLSPPWAKMKVKCFVKILKAMQLMRKVNSSGTFVYTTTPFWNLSIRLLTYPNRKITGYAPGLR